MFEVLSSGLQTTVQDLGRGGLLATGMPTSGAFDVHALRVANLLVGNNAGDRYLVGRDPGDAGLEMLLIGPRLRVLEDTIIAVTGADLGPMLNGPALPMWEAVRVRKGDLLSFPGPRQGARAYLAVAGGVEVPTVLGSRATNIRAFVGGIQGRPLEQGDIVRSNWPRWRPDLLDTRKVRQETIPSYAPPWELRVVLGPQDDLFLPESIDLFLAAGWQLSPVSDRMGCRFIGPQLHFKPRPSYLVEQAGSNPSNIVDDAIPVGGIQVPGGVEPIVMGPDGPSLGGYAKIATVISPDISRLAQVRPYETVRFEAVTVEEASRILSDTEALMSDPNKLLI